MPSTGLDAVPSIHDGWLALYYATSTGIRGISLVSASFTPFCAYFRTFVHSAVAVAESLYWIYI